MFKMEPALNNECKGIDRLKLTTLKDNVVTDLAVNQIETAEQFVNNLFRHLNHRAC